MGGAWRASGHAVKPHALPRPHDLLPVRIFIAFMANAHTSGEPGICGKVSGLARISEMKLPAEASRSFRPSVNLSTAAFQRAAQACASGEAGSPRRRRSPSAKICAR